MDGITETYRRIRARDSLVELPVQRRADRPPSVSLSRLGTDAKPLKRESHTSGKRVLNEGKQRGR